MIRYIVSWQQHVGTNQRLDETESNKTKQTEPNQTKLNQMKSKKIYPDQIKPSQKYFNASITTSSRHLGETIARYSVERLIKLKKPSGYCFG